MPSAGTSRTRTGAEKALLALRRAATVGIIATAVATGLGFAGDVHWRLDLLAHFRLHYAVASALALLIFALARNEIRVVVSALVLATNAALILPLWLADPGKPSPDATPIDVVLFNANSANERPDDVVASLAGSNADVIVLVEATPAVTARLAARLPGYRSIADPRRDPMGMAAFTRLPLESARVLSLVGATVSELELTVRRGAVSYAILAVHALPPVSQEHHAERGRVLAAAARWARRQSTPHIVLGDFNATPWSVAMRDLLADGNLVNSQMGHGMGGSWPRGASPFTIPIDHVVHSRDLTTVRRQTGPFLGSDHRSVRVSIAPRFGRQPVRLGSAHRLSTDGSRRVGSSRSP